MSSSPRASAARFALAASAAAWCGCALATGGFGTTSSSGAGSGGAPPTMGASSSSAGASATAGTGGATHGSASVTATAASTSMSSSATSASSSTSVSASSASASSSSGSGGADAGTTLCSDTAALVACYSFEQSLQDGSMHNHDAIRLGTSSYGGGETGQAARFSQGNYGKVADLTGWEHPQITIEMWIKPSSLPNPSQRAGLLDVQGSYSVFVYGNDTGHQDVVRCDVGGNLYGQVTLTQGVWTHVACVVGPSPNAGMDRTTLYINGKVDQTADHAPVTIAAASDVVIGANAATDGTDPFDGLIDDLRVFHVARTAAQICAAAGNPAGC